MTALAPSQSSTTAGLRRALHLVPALRKGLPGTLVLTVAGTALQIVVPVVVQRIIDGEILARGGVDVGGTVALGAVAIGAMIVAALVARRAAIRLATAAATGLSDLRVKTFRHLHSLSALHTQSERRGSLVARVTSDAYTIQDFMEWGGVWLIVGSSQVLLAITVMFVYQWQLALLATVGIVIYGGLLLWFQRILARAHDRVRERVADSLAALGEAISGLPVVRAYGAEAETLARLDRILDAQFRAEYRTGRLGAILFSSAELFAGVLTAAVIAAGILLGAGGSITAGTLVAFLFLVNLLVEPVQTMVETLNEAQSAGAGLRRILDVIDTPVDLPDAGSDAVALPEGGLSVAFDHVSLTYPGGIEALQDITVEIPAGRRVAVVGETGSGKTTFAKLATRLLDADSGTVSLGGVPIRRVRFAELRRRVAFVPQEGFLFGTTIAENVRYGRPGAHDDEVWQAFADLGLDGWLAEMPRGLATEVGERGGRLSSGERQLIALVRAWISNPDVLVLDEATSAVDPALEVRLRRAIEQLTQGRTSITVAHRLATAEAADEVIVFDRGRVVEQGHHDDVLGAGGVYAGLHADWSVGTKS